MAINFDNALGIHDDALAFRARRAAVLANNLANADTPNYKARDLDFSASLQRASEGMRRSELARTDSRHIYASSTSGDSDLLYRVPQQPSIDGNTVEGEAEHAKYMENAMDFQASFTFLNSKFTGLMSAVRGE